MKSKRIHYLVVVMAVICCIAVFIGGRLLTGSGITFYGSFNQVQPGMSETQVVAALGTANARTTEFQLGQYTGFEKEYAQAAASGSSYCLLWHKGIDVVYAIGFDKEGKVTMKAFGGT